MCTQADSTKYFSVFFCVNPRILDKKHKNNYSVQVTTVKLCENHYILN